MHIETLPVATNILFHQLSSLPDLKEFYLSGGTALALHIGHRESEDLDFFTQQEFDPQLMQQNLIKIGQIENVELSLNTLNAYLNKVKLQFLYYPYSLLEKPSEWNNIQISSLIDIACTKLITISMRGNKKDFIDLFFVLKEISLIELFNKLESKYTSINYNHSHILKSLIYFDDAENQPMPRMHKQANWSEIKQKITQEVKSYKF